MRFFIETLWFLYQGQMHLISFCCPLQVEDAVNRATNNNAGQELDILSLRAQLGSLTTVRISSFICIE
jgi:hypothetical protein